MTRTCVRPLVLSFPPSFTLSLFRFISLSPSLSLRPSSRPSLSLALVTRGYLSFYTPDGQVLLPLHARTPSAIISSARRCGLFSSLIRTNAGSRFHQNRLFRSLSHSPSLLPLFPSAPLIIKNQRLLKVRSPSAIVLPSVSSFSLASCTRGKICNSRYYAREPRRHQS